MRARYLIGLAAFVLCDCSYNVDDMAFVSIEALHDKQQTANLLFRFSTAINLRKAVEDTGADGIYARVSLCPFHQNVLVSIGRVKHNGIDLETKPARVCVISPGEPEKCTMRDDTPVVRAEVASTADKGPFVYEVPLVYNGNQSERYSADGGIAWRDIAMPHGRQDWCVKMEGPAMMDRGLTSNEFRIPKNAIAKALATADMPPHYRN